jgi:hypothetical protein
MLAGTRLSGEPDPNKLCNFLQYSRFCRNRLNVALRDRYGEGPMYNLDRNDHPDPGADACQNSFNTGKRSSNHPYTVALL